MRLAAHPGLGQSAGVNRRISATLELHQVAAPGLRWGSFCSRRCCFHHQEVSLNAGGIR